MKIESFRQNESCITIYYDNEKVYHIDFLENSIIHFYDSIGKYDIQYNSYTKESIEAKLNNHSLIIKTKKYIVTVGNDFLVTVEDIDGNHLYEQIKSMSIKSSNVNYDLLELEGHKVDKNENAKPISITQVLKEDDYIYGMGERVGFFNRRGYMYENWNTDDPSAHNESYRALYKSIPFYIIFNKEYQYGVFFDNHYHTYYDLGKTKSDELKMESDGGNYNFYFIPGDSLKDVVSYYTLITGRCEIPQLFTLGHQQSRWSYMSQQEVLSLAKDFRKNDIKCDVIHLDIDYMDSYKVFTTNPKTFSDFSLMIEMLHNLGFKVVTIIDPGTKVEKGYETYDKLIENQMVATKDGKVYINEVWPGESVYPTFNLEKTREFWAKEIKKLTDLGVDAIWDDMNEPASFKGPLPLDVCFGEDTHKEIHNLYGHFMAMATYQGLKEHTKKRPFVITRACFAGTQKYSTIWTGDNQSLWHHLRGNLTQLASLGLSGYSFVGSDVGGFGADCTPELLSRFVEAACIYPLFRNHSAMGTRRQEPWAFDQKTLDIYRKYVNLRYELIPYLYDLFYKETKDGIAPLRPLVLEYPKDSNTYSINDEVMLGESILVAPVLDQGVTKRMVYFPKGCWYDYFTNEKYTEGYHIVDAPLDKLPIFVKEGSVIPIGKFGASTSHLSEITFKVYPGSGKYLHYQDDGESYKYLEGEYNTYQISHVDDVVKIKNTHKGIKEYSKIYIDYLGWINEVDL